MKSPDSSKHIYSVSDITNQISNLLESNFSNIIVEGEISGYKVSPSGHAYFKLKDESATLDGVIWRHIRQRIVFPIEDGLKVLAFGNISVYAPQGRYQIVVNRMEPAGLGELQQKFEILKAKLAAEGLFDSSRKKPVPFLPYRVGIITSPTGAAIRDFLKTIRTGFPGGHFEIYGTRVQGREAPPEICKAIEYFNRVGEVEVIIITRGGGSLEDLWTFNEEIVVRAIAGSNIPVISAVGHEIDFTLADFAADLRLPTPTAAANFIVENRESVMQEVSELKRRILKSLEASIRYSREQFQSLKTQIRRLAPVSEISRRRQRIDELLLRMSSLVKNNINLKRQKLTGLESRLPVGLVQNIQRIHQKVFNLRDRINTLSPKTTLARGYSICKRTSTGEIIRNPDRTFKGDGIEVHVHGGQINAEVMELIVKN
jgi:exodeoxyribonuclease VII large subunit